MQAEERRRKKDIIHSVTGPAREAETEQGGMMCGGYIVVECVIELEPGKATLITENGGVADRQ